MKLERRYYDYQNILNEKNFDGFEIISFGSETCMNRVPDSHFLKELLLFCKEKGKIAKCVFPRIDAFNILRMEESIQILQEAKQQIQVVINDWGCLLFAKETEGNIEYFLGRQLTRSIVDCPWYHNVIESETDEVKKELLRLPFYFQEKLDMLREYRISGLELNSIEGVEDSISTIAQLGWNLAVHMNEYLLTCGKECLSKRILGETANCDVCKKKLMVEPIAKWKNSLDTRESFNQYEQDLLKGMYIQGKAVYLPQRGNREDIVRNENISIGIECV